MKSTNITAYNLAISKNFDGEILNLSFERQLVQNDELREYFANEYIKYLRIKNSILKIKTRISNLF